MQQFDNFRSQLEIIVAINANFCGRDLFETKREKKTENDTTVILFKILGA